MDIYNVRNIIFKRDGNKCYKCPSTDKLVLDHIDPKYISHNHSIYNIITLCWSCNYKKSRSLLGNEELHKLKQYLEKVNEQFNDKEKNEMESIIRTYFNNKKRVSKRKVKIKILTFKELQKKARQMYEEKYGKL